MKNYDKQKLSQIKIIAFDIDGTLTDGSIYIGPQGEALKVFNVKDGYALRKAEDIGYKIYFITGRKAYEPTVQRVLDLRLDLSRLKDKIPDKVVCAQQILDSEGLTFENMAFMGDDLPDLGLLEKVAFSGVPSDCTDSLIDKVHFVSKFQAGKGAVREFIDLIFANSK